MIIQILRCRLMPELLRGVALLTVFSLATVAWAQAWTVQTAAFQDYRQARAQVEELRALGFDAYSEFAMQGATQYARVRVGCFDTRRGAATFARELQGNVTGEAVAQPMTPGAATRTCLSWDTGLLKPGLWRVERSGNDIVFRVELGGQVGYLRHDGTSWQFRHTMPAEPQAPVESADRFREVRVGGMVLAQATLSDGSVVNSCPGRLLWQAGLVAILERPNTVIACVVEESAPAAAR